MKRVGTGYGAHVNDHVAKIQVSTHGVKQIISCLHRTSFKFLNTNCEQFNITYVAEKSLFEDKNVIFRRKILINGNGWKRLPHLETFRGGTGLGLGIWDGTGRGPEFCPVKGACTTALHRFQVHKSRLCFFRNLLYFGDKKGQ